MSVMEIPELVLGLQSVAGSFDCVVVGFANDNSAQDDRVLLMQARRVVGMLSLI
jgi:hypothetical protein